MASRPQAQINFTSNLMSDDQRNRWLPFAILGVALVIWAGVLAAGAYLEWGADKPQHDLRKPLVILGCMAVFLVFWGLALWRRARRGGK